ncbi:hypothetical protein HY450_01110 [Candidatus Pacearchaeota archaeon]|nr:hypothetical protein [Candidatus Pacearchaeota archaeon]
MIDETQRHDYIGVDFEDNHYVLERQWGEDFLDSNKLKNYRLYKVVQTHTNGNVRLQRVKDNDFRDKVVPLVIREFLGDED